MDTPNANQSPPELVSQPCSLGKVVKHQDCPSKLGHCGQEVCSLHLGSREPGPQKAGLWLLEEGHPGIPWKNPPPPPPRHQKPLWA